MAHDYPLIVFSHLRWDFVYQRPQHLISRLARTRRVYFIEEPVQGDGPAWSRRKESGLTVLQPILSGPVAGFDERHRDELLSLLERLARSEALDQGIAWLYSPLAVSLLPAIRPRLVVYDCMDELSLFRGASPALVEREAQLLRDAHLVFTGGPSLYRAKQARHTRVYCFPSSVDAAHFSQARPVRPLVREAEDQRALPAPRLGFFGVLDERLDLPLLDHLARTRPDWQIVMVGPVVKIDPADLPRHPNLHYFGQRDYRDLPRYLRGWDVCLLPFARNEATRFISPTKTLEYMAAERPIVSTPIQDVAEPYPDTVFLANTPEEFVRVCDQALALRSADREALVRRMRRVVAATSWERTAARMSGLVERELGRLSGSRERRAVAV